MAYINLQSKNYPTHCGEWGGSPCATPTLRGVGERRWYRVFRNAASRTRRWRWPPLHGRAPPALSPSAVRHQDFRLKMTEIRSDLDREDASFIFRDGLIGMGGGMAGVISLECA